jgi:hypothetical protein
MKEELRRPRFSSAYYTRNVGVGIEGHAALVVDDNESRIERSAASPAAANSAAALTSFADAFV